MHFKGFGNYFFYKLFKGRDNQGSLIRMVLVLWIPFCILGCSYLYFKRAFLYKLDTFFVITLIIASFTFIIAPILLFKWFRKFISFKANRDIEVRIRTYFKFNESYHFRIYKTIMLIFSPIVIFIGLSPVYMNESILSKTLGLTYEDPFFYFTVVFLIWFLFFCTNAVAVSILMNFIVIKIKQNDIINYNPTKIMSRDSISIILKFCNTTVFYGCCALLFLPLGIYCIINNIEPFWVIRMLFTYSFFVISTLTLPKFIFYSYIKHKTNRYLIHERAKFYEGILDANHSLYNNATALAEQIYLANRYWFLQEIKANYASPVGLDSSSVVTYISAILSFLTAILSEVIKLALNKPLT